MTLISLVCLFVLTTSAFGRSAYGGYEIASIPQIPKVLPMMKEVVIPKTYGQPAPFQPQETFATQPKLVSSYGSFLTAPVILPKTLPIQTYAPMPVIPQFDQPQIPLPILSEADMRCKGQQPETVIPLENPRKFVVCLDDSKGVEQECPKGLVYHLETQRCERKLGPLENACASQPCLNGGQCVPMGSSYQCQCAQGFDGVTCELDARVCQYQNPCGQAPDAKCQSFRLGAALQYICIFQDGLGYGLNAQQIVPSPCQSMDGPQALAVANTGFIMCDGERMFVESCPGGTIWDDASKACSWPDMQTPPLQEDRPVVSSYGQSSYAVVEQPKVLPTLAYTAQLPVPQVKPVHVFTNQVKHMKALHMPKVIPQQVVSYAAVKPKFIEPKPVLSYGAEIIKPKFIEQPKPVLPTYGAEVMTQPIFQQPKTIQSYSSRMIVPKTIELPQPIQTTYSQTPLFPTETRDELVSIKQGSSY